jgi:carbonic anhydrase
LRSNLDPKSRLIDGNAVFKKSVDPTFLAQMCKTHEPFVAVLTCSDARVDPAKIFNLSLGDAFVVRVAGNVGSDSAVIGSLEYAVEHLGVKTVVVLGHTDCGAIKVTMDGAEPGNLGSAVKDIDSARAKLECLDAKDPDKVSEANVKLQLRMLVDRSCIMREAANDGSLSILGAMFDISTGAVRFI